MSRRPTIGDHLVWIPRPGVEIRSHVIALTGAYESHGLMTAEREDGQFFHHLPQKVVEEPYWRFEERYDG